MVYIDLDQIFLTYMVRKVLRDFLVVIKHLFCFYCIYITNSDYLVLIPVPWKKIYDIKTFRQLNYAIFLKSNAWHTFTNTYNLPAVNYYKRHFLNTITLIYQNGFFHVLTQFFYLKIVRHWLFISMNYSKKKCTKKVEQLDR